MTVFLETVTNKTTKRLQENIGTPLNCAGFYLEEAISQRISRGYKITKVEILHDNVIHDLIVYQITHVNQDD